MWSSRIDTVDRGSVFLVEENSMEVNLRLQVGGGGKPVGSPSECPCGYTVLEGTSKELIQLLLRNCVSGR